MNKKIIHSILIVATVAVGMGTLSSCKDNTDSWTEIESQQASLQAKIAALETQLSTLQSAQASCKSDCATELQNLREQIANCSSQADLAVVQGKISNLEALQSKITTIDGTLTTIQNNITTLKQDLANDVAGLKSDLQGNIDGVKNSLTGEINNAKDSLGNEINDVKNDLSDLNGEVSNVKDSLNDVKNDLSDLSGQVNDLNNDVNDLTGSVNDLTGSVNDLTGQVSGLSGQLTNATDSLGNVINGLSSSLDTFNTTFNNEISAVNTQLAGINERLDGIDLDAIETEIDNLKTSMNTVESNLDALTEKVDAILGRLNKLVTSVLVQSTENPVVGSYSSPLNTQSNILMAYYGTNTTDISQFPTIRSSQEYNGAQVITDADWAMLGKNGAAVKTVTIDNSSDYLIHDAEGNAGTLYLTINPNNVDFTGLTATLVNSRDEESGVKLGSLKKSDKLLSFGVSRSSSDNGFYEATATITPAQIPSVKVNIESGLQSAFKSVLTERSVKSFASLANTVYSQLNNYLPAEGVKVAWKSDDGTGVEKDYAVYSQYNIAATAFKPLSFKFLAGTSSPVTLPTISPLSGLSIDRDKFSFNINLEPFEMKGVDINFQLGTIDLTDKINSTIEVSASGSGSGSGSGSTTLESGEKITVTVDVKVNVDNVTGSADLTDFILDIQNSLNDQIATWNTSMKESFDDAINDLVSQINDQVNDMMDSVTASIDENIDKIIDEIESELNGSGLFSRLNSYINKYNSLATRINNVISNPNHYLQSLLAYSANGSLQLMSTSKNSPSPVTLNGGNAITLYATTYTAELVVPTFYKFVGVTDAWVNGDQSKSAKKGNSGAKSAVTTANATEYMATPLNGNQTKVPMKLKSGYTYEIVYSALDYHGVTSTRKYYLRVK